MRVHGFLARVQSLRLSLLMRLVVAAAFVRRRSWVPLRLLLLGIAVVGFVKVAGWKWWFMRITLFASYASSQSQPTTVLHQLPLAVIRSLCRDLAFLGDASIPREWFGLGAALRRRPMLVSSLVLLPLLQLRKFVVR